MSGTAIQSKALQTDAKIMIDELTRIKEDLALMYEVMPDPRVDIARASVMDAARELMDIRDLGFVLPVGVSSPVFPDDHPDLERMLLSQMMDAAREDAEDGN